MIKALKVKETVTTSKEIRTSVIVPSPVWKEEGKWTCKCGNRGIWRSYFLNQLFYCEKCQNTMFRDFTTSKTKPDQISIDSTSEVCRDSLQICLNEQDLQDYLEANDYPTEVKMSITTEPVKKQPTDMLTLEWTEVYLEKNNNPKRYYVDIHIVHKKAKGALNTFVTPKSLSSHDYYYYSPKQRNLLVKLPLVVLTHIYGEERAKSFYNKINDYGSNNSIRSRIMTRLTNEPWILTTPGFPSLIDSDYLALLTYDLEMPSEMSRRFNMVNLNETKIYKILNLDKSIYKLIPAISIYANASTPTMYSRLSILDTSTYSTYELGPKELLPETPESMLSILLRNDANETIKINNKDECYERLRELAVEYKISTSSLKGLLSDILELSQIHIRESFKMEELIKKYNIESISSHNSKVITYDAIKKYIGLTAQFKYNPTSLKNYLASQIKITKQTESNIKKLTKSEEMKKYLDESKNINGYTYYNNYSNFYSTLLKEMARIHTDLSNLITSLYDLNNMSRLMSCKCNKYPTNTMKSHDSIQETYNIWSVQNKDEVENKCIKEVYCAYKGLEVTDEDAGLSLVLPKTPSDIINEGIQLHHCVASYVTSVVKKTSLICFVRDTQKIDQPFYTVELSPTDLKIRQIKGIYNKNSTAKINNFVNKAITKFVR